ncbi:hypothetical protein CHCC20335_4303 [Bacillus paralicheniformis]|nr:hypothetical protein CHCC20335_4303 [Bacillus paralicheniformis]
MGKGPKHRWRRGVSYVEHPQPLAKKPVLRPAPPYIHDTPPPHLY